MMNLKIGDIVKAKDCEIRLVVVGASEKGYDLYSVWPYYDRFICWEVDADGHGDILSVVPDPEWDAKKITNLQKKNRKGRYLTKNQVDLTKYQVIARKMVKMSSFGLINGYNTKILAGKWV